MSEQARVAAQALYDGGWLDTHEFEVENVAAVIAAALRSTPEAEGRVQSGRTASLTPDTGPNEAELQHKAASDPLIALAAELRARAEKARVRRSRIAARTGRADYQEGKADALDEAAALVESRKNRGDHPGETVAESSQEARVERGGRTWRRQVSAVDKPPPPAPPPPVHRHTFTCEVCGNSMSKKPVKRASTEPAPAVREEARDDLAKRVEAAAGKFATNRLPHTRSEYRQVVADLYDAAEALRSTARDDLTARALEAADGLAILLDCILADGFVEPKLIDEHRSDLSRYRSTRAALARATQEPEENR